MADRQAVIRRTIRIVAIGGTRPEAIKLAPLMRVMLARPDVDFTQVGTGQHPKMFDDALAEFGLRADISLALPNDGAGFAEEAERRIVALLHDLSPDLVIVQGDTNSAWAAARAAHSLGLPIGHVEAGLRSGDPAMPWPEERNRKDIDALSTLLFAPSAQAAANIAGQGNIIVTGNTGIDALQAIRPRTPAVMREDGRRILLVTAHRSETIPELDAVCDALLQIAERDDVAIYLPVHPNPAVARRVKSRLGGSRNITLEPPLPYSELVALLARATLVLTDSGGLQEEAPALGIPALILRTITERPEVIASGNVRLVGLDARVIVRNVLQLLDDPAAYAAMATPAFPYGEGDAAHRIADAIADWWADGLRKAHD